MEKHKSVGSDFEDWLAAEGILEEVEITATKKAFVIQLQAEMKKKKIGKSRLAKIKNTSRTAIERLLDPCQPSNLATLIKTALAYDALGEKMRLIFVFFCICTHSLFAGFGDLEAQFKACPAKQQAWQETTGIINRTVDSLGNPIDEKIKETVIALNLLGIKTIASCEGHIDHGTFYPWIDIEVGEREVFEAFNKNLVTLGEEINRLGIELKHEGVDIHRNQRLIELYSRNKKLWESREEYYLQHVYPVLQLLREFYSTYPLSYGTTILPHRLTNYLRIYSSDGEWQLLRAEEEKKAKLSIYSQEMGRFTDFLIEKFLAQ